MCVLFCSMHNAPAIMLQALVGIECVKASSIPEVGSAGGHRRGRRLLGPVDGGRGRWSLLDRRRACYPGEAIVACRGADAAVSPTGTSALADQRLVIAETIIHPAPVNSRVGRVS